MIVPLALSLGAAQAAAAAAPVREVRCAYQVRDGAGYRSVMDPNLQVLAGAAEPGPFRPARPEDAVAVQCGRTSIVPGPNDDEVIGLGLPLYIVDIAAAAARMGVLEISQGRYRYRMIQGSFSATEGEAIMQRLNMFSRRSRDEAPAASPD